MQYNFKCSSDCFYVSQFYPLSPKSDQYQNSPCEKQISDEN